MRRMKENYTIYEDNSVNIKEIVTTLRGITEADIQDVVANNPSKYELIDNGNNYLNIRALTGHSIQFVNKEIPNNKIS